MHLLITRPYNQACRTAEKLQNLGHECTLDPLLKIEDVGTQIPEGVYDAIIVTSSNALPLLNKHWSLNKRSEIPVITTGEVTKSEIKNLGFDKCVSVNGSAIDLADRFSSLIPNAKKILYPCAKEVSVNLVQILSSSDRSCTPWVVYRMNKAQKLAFTTLNLLKSEKIDGILLYSSKTAEVFADLWIRDCNELPIPKIYTLSEKICGILPPQMSLRCSSPVNPNENDLFKLISKSTINTPE